MVFIHWKTATKHLGKHWTSWGFKVKEGLSHSPPSPRRFCKRKTFFPKKEENKQRKHICRSPSPITELMLVTCFLWRWRQMCTLWPDQPPPTLRLYPTLFFYHPPTPNWSTEAFSSNSLVSSDRSSLRYDAPLLVKCAAIFWDFRLTHYGCFTRVAPNHCHMMNAK